MKVHSKIKKPDWLKITIPSGESFKDIRQHRSSSGLATVCEEAKCPNIGDCWKSGTATFMLLGDVCTRACRFCSVKTAKHPSLPDVDEPTKLAEIIKSLKLKYVVLTTVDRDDLADQGAGHIKRCVEEILLQVSGIMVETLVPDFQGKTELIETVAYSGAQIIGHNLECVRRLTDTVRDPRASYRQSLFVLETLKKVHPGIHTKSSLMLGFGETRDEILEAMSDIKNAGVDFLTLGQYLQPNKKKLPVTEYIHPDQFKQLEQEGLAMGFDYVASGPLVRSSYKAAENYLRAKVLGKNTD